MVISLMPTDGFQDEKILAQLRSVLSDSDHVEASSNHIAARAEHLVTQMEQPAAMDSARIGSNSTSWTAILNEVCHGVLCYW